MAQVFGPSTRDNLDLQKLQQKDPFEWDQIGPYNSTILDSCVLPHFWGRISFF